MATQREERIQYWKKSAEYDYSVMLSLFKTGKYLWSLFMGHLVIEKLLKACYVKNINMEVPHSHDLSRLAAKAKLKLTEIQEDELDNLTKFNVSARYPDYKFEMYKITSKEYAANQLKFIRGFKRWLLQQI